MQLNEIHHTIIQSALDEYSKRPMPQPYRVELFKLQVAMLAGTVQFTPYSKGYNFHLTRIERTPTEGTQA